MFMRTLFVLTVSLLCLQLNCSAAQPFVYHEIVEVSDGTCTLDDGSIWRLHGDTSAIVQYDFIWIHPFMPNNVQAVLFSFGFIPTIATLIEGSTTLQITSIPSAGTVALSDGSEWTLDPYYSQFTGKWQPQDPITVAGGQNEVYLINASEITNVTTYALATQTASKSETTMQK